MSKTPHIAFLGIGLMGSRMSKRLLEAGFSVSIWNRSPAACEPLVQAGAQLLALEAAGTPDILMLCLADDAAVHDVVQQLLPYLRAGQTIIDFSSLSVQMTQQLASQVASRQVAWVDAPVSGGVMGAETGSLVVFAGGEQAIVEQLAPVFAPLAQRVTYMGKNGTGQATKICNQLIVAASSTLISEAVELAKRAGVDTTLLAPALAGGFADSKPLQILAPRMASQTFTPVQWKVQTLAKDLNNAVNLARLHKLDIPVASSALSQLEQHQAQGHREDDLSSIILIHQCDVPTIK
ncbi:NAD(P)-dependent oxidoreductase [Alkanindiges sp. WGS2144]|uniref:NAD(P)-dependent oxidoreductase n=1 Tax=Alkanindiges sp. WGS2144 TaxID=3366808 RepID=UPI0037503A61